jgi:hypothetical protein
MMNILRLFTLACLLSPLGNIDKVEQKKIEAQTKPSYLCDCGWRDALMWNDAEMMLSTY